MMSAKGIRRKRGNLGRFRVFDGRANMMVKHIFAAYDMDLQYSGEADFAKI